MYAFDTFPEKTCVIEILLLLFVVVVVLVDDDVIIITTTPYYLLGQLQCVLHYYY